MGTVRGLDNSKYLLEVRKLRDKYKQFSSEKLGIRLEMKDSDNCFEEKSRKNKQLYEQGKETRGFKYNRNC